MPLFEIGIYNQKVRDLLDEGNHHKQLDDDWADVHYFEIKATSEEAAKAKVFAAHPAHQGYILDYIGEIDTDE